MKILGWVVAFSIAVIVSIYINHSDTFKPDIDQKSLNSVANFLLWQRKETEITYEFCERGGYKLDKFLTVFAQINQPEQEWSDQFIASLEPMEKMAFRKELNHAVLTMKPQIMEQLQKSYEEAKRSRDINGIKYSVYEYCQYIDEHAAELLSQAKKQDEHMWLNNGGAEVEQEYYQQI